MAMPVIFGLGASANRRCSPSRLPTAAITGNTSRRRGVGHFQRQSGGCALLGNGCGCTWTGVYRVVDGLGAGRRQPERAPWRLREGRRLSRPR